MTTALGLVSAGRGKIPKHFKGGDTQTDLYYRILPTSSIMQKEPLEAGEGQMGGNEIYQEGSLKTKVLTA